jgi:hypothetical protein
MSLKKLQNTENEQKRLSSGAFKSRKTIRENMNKIPQLWVNKMKD